MLNNDLVGDLKRLRLPAMADNLDLRVREAQANKLGYLEFAALLLQDELASRESNSFQKRLTRISQCAVKGVLFPAGAKPARQLSLQPEALETVQGGNELD